VCEVSLSLFQCVERLPINHGAGKNPSEFTRLVLALLRALDEEPSNSDPASRFARSGIEAAILDLFCVHSQIPVHHPPLCFPSHDLTNTCA
jgi:L-alanine-DL-glutamate epimerase-like enolase superfamily enzyme